MTESKKKTNNEEKIGKSERKTKGEEKIWKNLKIKEKIGKS